MLSRSCYKYVLSLFVDNAAVRVKFLQLRVLTTVLFQLLLLSQSFQKDIWLRKVCIRFEIYNVIHICCITIAPLSESVLVINNKLAIHHVQILKLRVQLVLAATCSFLLLHYRYCHPWINIYVIYERHLQCHGTWFIFNGKGYFSYQFFLMWVNTLAVF